MEAEYAALADVVQGSVVRGLLQEIRWYYLSHTETWRQPSSYYFRLRSSNISQSETRGHKIPFSKEKLLDDTVILHVPSTDNLADFLTKPLLKAQLKTKLYINLTC